jgi:hypothetical protein
MQVNSAQDYLTLKKRQILAATYSTTPPPQQQKFPSVYRSIAANQATQRQRFVTPTASAWGSVPGTATFSSECSTCIVTQPTVANTKDSNILRRDIAMPMSVHAGIVG